MRTLRLNHASGFTLVEIVLAIGFIALLAAVAVPCYRVLNESTRVGRFVRRLQAAEQALRQYAAQNGGYPPNVTTRTTPDGLQTHLPVDFDWSAETPLGGNWNWDGKARTTWGFYFEYGISVSSLYSSPMSQRLFEEVDRRIDDGNLKTGAFRRHDQSWSTYSYAIQDNVSVPGGMPAVAGHADSHESTENIEKHLDRVLADE